MARFITGGVSTRVVTSGTTFPTLTSSFAIAPRQCSLPMVSKPANLFYPIKR